MLSITLDNPVERLVCSEGTSFPSYSKQQDSVYLPNTYINLLARYMSGLLLIKGMIMRPMPPRQSSGAA